MRTKMTPHAAEILALKGLAFLADSGDPMDRFLALSGMDASKLRQRATEPEFLGAVLDFMLSDEALLTGFCEADSIDSRDIHAARHALSGG